MKLHLSRQQNLLSAAAKSAFTAVTAAAAVASADRIFFQLATGQLEKAACAASFSASPFLEIRDTETPKGVEPFVTSYRHVFS